MLYENNSTVLKCLCEEGHEYGKWTQMSTVYHNGKYFDITVSHASSK
jgi:hypothetical protein